MHLPTVASALLLPLLAVADQTTVTSTRYQTLTKTVTLSRAAVATGYASNSTSLYSTAPTVQATSTPAVPTTTSSLLPVPTNGGSALGGAAHVAVVAMAGAVVAVFL
ncbi:hypothetical protein B0H66DRAFT_95784 [Apodospora peruviana]|uniref:Uncharacterized protein n=1 Tax=Apodospora peruviana TaxID=516989 RepID=A0AAE0MG53_9PEZI|nr:hypothetical protein B0H66DRAFT_95784 [Apodospora peruviana]